MKTLTIALGLLFLIGCQTAQHISDSESTWITLRSMGSDRPYWCTVVKDNSKGPTCFEANILSNGGRYLNGNPWK